jgi:hypothetical protein
MASDVHVDVSRENLREIWIERLARQLDMPAYLVARGFNFTALDPDSTRLTMANDDGQSVLLQKDLDRAVWRYTNPADPKDQGTIADFIVNRDRVTRDACLERLVGCADRTSEAPEGIAYREAFQHKPDELWRAEERHLVVARTQRDALRSLEHLGVERGTLDQWRFGQVKNGGHVGRLLQDPRTLEHSSYRPTDRALVLIERPIDAIAYERARGRQRVCYLYTGDRPDLETTRKIAQIVSQRPAGLEVVLAFGRDERGHHLAAEVERHLPGVKVERQTPEFGARWSDQMQIERRHARSIERGGGADQEVTNNKGRPPVRSLPRGVDRTDKRLRDLLAQALDAGISPAALESAVRGIERRPARPFDRSR